ncbi:MAG: hypothetical protein ACE5J3_07395 [Methanosarcinales archaeon]
MILQIIGIQWTDPLTQFGEISSLVLISSIIAIIGFFVAGIFIYLYYKKFFVGEIPKGWKYFFIGLILSSLYQLLKVPFTYRWIYGDVYLIIFLVFQVIVIGILVYGLNLMKKEVEIK